MRWGYSRRDLAHQSRGLNRAGHYLLRYLSVTAYGPSLYHYTLSVRSRRSRKSTRQRHCNTIKTKTDVQGVRVLKFWLDPRVDWHNILLSYIGGF